MFSLAERNWEDLCATLNDVLDILTLPYFTYRIKHETVTADVFERDMTSFNLHIARSHHKQPKKKDCPMKPMVKLTKEMQ